VGDFRILSDIRPDAGNGIIGNLEWAGLKGVGGQPYADYAATIPHQAFMIFQCMFAVITRLSSSGHTPRGSSSPDSSSSRSCGRLSSMTSRTLGMGDRGVAQEPRGPGLCRGDRCPHQLGHLRTGPGRSYRAADRCGQAHLHTAQPALHGPGRCAPVVRVVRFQCRKRLAANDLAANAFVTTTVATAAAGLTWALIEWQQHGSPTVLGIVTGAVAGSSPLRRPADS